MRTKSLMLILVIGISHSNIGRANTTFTYQGELQNNGSIKLSAMRRDGRKSTKALEEVAQQPNQQNPDQE